MMDETNPDAPAPCEPRDQEGKRDDARPARILFLCTHNKARSQLAEGICRKLGGEEVEALSAGSEPSAVHPCAVEVLTSMGIDASGQRSKHMNEFLEQRIDYVVTVCDQVRELCPLFPGAPQHMHWSIEDPSRVMGSEAVQREAFEQVARQLTARVQHLLAGIKRRDRSSASPAQDDKDH